MARKKEGSRVANTRAMRESQAKQVTQDRGYWSNRINSAVRKTAESIIDIGHLLTEAKAALPHGEWLSMIEEDLPFTPSTAQRLKKIAADERLTNAARVQYLPPAWGTLYELTKLDDRDFDTVAARLTPETTRREVKEMVAESRPRERPPAAPASDPPARREPTGPRLVKDDEPAPAPAPAPPVEPSPAAEPEAVAPELAEPPIDPSEKRIPRGIRMAESLWAFVDEEAEARGDRASALIERWVAEKRDRARMLARGAR